MVKNSLQEQCGQEMIQLLEQISLENKESSEQNFPIKMFSKENLSRGAQRNFDNLMKILSKIDSGPRPNFVEEIEN